MKLDSLALPPQSARVLLPKTEANEGKVKEMSAEMGEVMETTE